MTEETLFALALEAFNESWATGSIAAKVDGGGDDRRLRGKICRLMFEKGGGSLEAYQRALRDFILLSEEFVMLQFELDRTGRYRYSSYDEVREKVYDNAELMDHQYLNGLFLSSAFWVNHTKILNYFVEAFCGSAAPSGRLLEVPVGTGIFISEFARRNPGWTVRGVDISESSVAFSKEIARLNGAPGVTIAKEDVFESPADVRYDRIICGELLEHLEDPQALLDKLARLLGPNGSMFLTTAIWAASIDHIFLYRSAREVREMLQLFFRIESELVLNVRDGHGPEDEKTPINYACILTAKA